MSTRSKASRGSFNSLAGSSRNEDIPVIGNGYSWLRQFLPYAGAANIANQSCTMVGLGREAFAYPDAPRDIMEKGKMNPRKVCIPAASVPN